MVILLLVILTILLIIKFSYINIWFVLKSVFIPTIVSVLVFYIILYPQEIIEASKNGLRIWFNAVLPSLLPFFIGSELLIGLGVVKFIGTLIEPLIRPVFRVPGEASFVFTMSITSGYPMGAKLVSDLQQKGSITKIEAQRMLSFCSTSGPLFMIGAVSIGMFNNQSIGPTIAVCHYLGAITVGLFFRYYGENTGVYKYIRYNENIIKKAFNAMLKAKEEDGRSFGKLMGDSVKNSISTLLLIGGMIVLFSVIITELRLSGIFNLIYFNIKHLSNDDTFLKELISILITGFIEITMGCKVISESISLNPVLQIVLVTMIISWSGLSIHAQSISLMNVQDIRIDFYFLAKFLHSIFSGVYVLILLKFTGFEPLYNDKEVFSHSINRVMSYSWLDKLLFSTQIFLFMILGLLFLCVVTKLVRD